VLQTPDLSDGAQKHSELIQSYECGQQCLSLAMAELS
jgi:hypothetical protein